MITVLLLHFYYLIGTISGYSMMTSFCDGSRLVELTHDQCPFGINFGESKPTCVCIKGAYRMWLDNCAVYDGFMEDGCSTLTQNEFSVSGLRLGGSIESLFNTTAGVFGLKETDYQVWNTYGVGSKVKTTTNNLYVVNGIAYFVEDKICISPKTPVPSAKQVCRIFRADNPVWKPGSIDVEVSHVCSQTAAVELKVYNCYDVIQQAEQSECALACKKPFHQPSVIHAGTGFKDKDGQQGTWTNTDLNETDVFKNDKDCKKVSPPKIRDEKNIYINRNLNRWAKLRQVKDIERPNLLGLMPKRSWGLFDMMKQITQLKCPSKYVSQLFMDQAIDLFIMVHQGKGNRYIEVINEEDYNAIYKILEDCMRFIRKSPKGASLPMYSVDHTSSCGSYDKLVGASIPHPPGQNLVWINETIEVDHEFDKYNHHFVIEAAWKIVDMVQNICFDSFGDEYILFHTWEQAMEKLFTREVRNLWFFPNSDVRVYQILLSPTAITDLHNLELCVKAAYMIDPRLKRLERPRPSLSNFRRKKRSMDEVVTKIHDVHCHQSERDFQYPC